jgi:hypothetical protein
MMAPMTRRRLLALLALGAIGLAVAGCRGGHGPTTSSAGPSESPPQPAAAFVSKEGLVLTVELDRWQVAPGGSVVAQVTLRNDRQQPVEYMSSGCQPVTWTVKLPLPIDPQGRQWPGIAGEFKTYALAQGLGPGGVPALQAIDTAPPFPVCNLEPGRTFLGAGDTAEWTLTWPAELVAGVPALSGVAPFTVSMRYDPDRAVADARGIGILPLRFQSWQQIAIDGALDVKGEAPRPLSAGQAIDVVLSDARFGAWLAQSPRATWEGANVFLQSWPKNEGILPAGPTWSIELFREPRNWAISQVQPYTGELRLNFCNIPCDR